MPRLLITVAMYMCSCAYQYYPNEDDSDSESIKRVKRNRLSFLLCNCVLSSGEEGRGRKNGIKRDKGVGGFR
jgi:hypothetical protein